MRVLIIENETYLAQSIASKLNSFGYICNIIPAIEHNGTLDYEVILLSSSACGDHYENFIQKNSKSIIIMLVSYISDDTISKPLRSGASDYILKPFMIDELLRKIEHYKYHKEILEKINFYNSYFNFVQRELNTPSLPQYQPPFIIKSNSQRSADIYAMKYARDKNINFIILSFRDQEWKNILKNPPQKEKYYYITNLEELKKNEMKILLESISKYNFILSIISDDIINFSQIVDITHIVNNQDLGGEILSIKEYEQAIITKFGERYPDVELARKLGISRKSLWEKRKKYGISKKK